MRLFAIPCVFLLSGFVAAQKTDSEKKAAIKKAWTVAEPAHTSKEKKWCSAVHVRDDAAVVIANRGMIQSAQKFTKVRVSCAWTYKAKDEIPREYHDELWIVLRASGKRNEWPYDPKDGIAVIVRPKDFKPLVIATCKAKGSPDVQEHRSSNLILFRDGFCPITVEDRGDKIVVFADYKEALSWNVSPADPGHVLVFNGEPYPGPKVTTLQSLTLEEWKPDK